MKLIPHRLEHRARSALAGAGFAALVAAAAGLLPVPRVHAQSPSPPPLQAQVPDPQPILDAREALRKKDRARLLVARDRAVADGHPLAVWTDYWELNNRLAEAEQPELEAFYARHPASYLEDRLRNDWLLELGRRGDWANFAREYPRFRMDDDREVRCWALHVRQLAGEDVRAEALDAWLGQREADRGCAQLAQGLLDAGRFGPGEVWLKARRSIDAGRLRAATQAVGLLGPELAQAADEVADSPVRYLARKAAPAPRRAAELATLALLRMAATDREGARRLLDERWSRDLPADLAAWAWASLGREAAQALDAEAPDFFLTAQQRLAAPAAKGEAADSRWSDDTLAWKARAALRASAGSGASVPQGTGRWLQVLQAVDAMSPEGQQDPAWIYWKARALQALAAGSSEPEARRAQARELLERLAGGMDFYGLLAAEDLGRRPPRPAAPAPVRPTERAAAEAHPGLSRALLLFELGLRGEAVREWNFSLRGMDDRQLLASAALACAREIWDRCINTSDRTKGEIDLVQRYPMPFQAEVTAQAREVGLDAAYVYGLIRQESRFIMDARSSAGASGLMQLMPATARWTARKLGIPYTTRMINDRDMNLRLGTGYLKLALDDFGGSQALAAAAYNAGPGRPRRWREGPTLEVAAWAENIPFAETRDYVKKVLSNATYYAVRLGDEPPSLKRRLGPPVGPAPALNPDLP